ncbi:MAG: arginine--tRNA ligase, partial [Chloroflexota bacterium]|nr:arginine--tRNA ligase [Chloroflexota bacterium]
MNTTNTISKIIEASIERAKECNEFPDFGSKKIIVEKPKNKSFGNWSTNIALTLSKELKKNPLEIAEIIKSNINNSSIIETIEIIPPGFINFRL